MNRSRRALAIAGLAAVALTLVACGDDDDSGGATTAAPTTTERVPTTTARPATTTTPPPTTSGAPSTTQDGGGGMQAGAPQFLTFEVTPSVACESGNGEVTMSYTTMNVVDISIKIGDGDFEETAGYGPNETSVVASIPCSGATSSSVQLKGCTEDGECAESPVRDVQVTG
jgi:hypothetical protein